MLINKYLSTKKITNFALNKGLKLLTNITNSIINTNIFLERRNKYEIYN